MRKYLIGFVLLSFAIYRFGSGVRKAEPIPSDYETKARNESASNSQTDKPVRAMSRVTASVVSLKPQANTQNPRIAQTGDLDGSSDKHDFLKPVLQRVPMTHELWLHRLSRISPTMRKVIGTDTSHMPDTALITDDDEMIVSSGEMKLQGSCEALNQASSAISVSVNEKGEVQDAQYIDPDESSPMPPGIFDCKFSPYMADGKPIAVTTGMVPPSELSAVMARFSGN